MTSDEHAARRKQIVEEIHVLAAEYARTWGEHEDGHVAAYYLVADVLLPTGARSLIEISDENSSRFTSMGMLFASLHDPRWLPRADADD